MKTDVRCVKTGYDIINQNGLVKEF